MCRVDQVLSYVVMSNTGAPLGSVLFLSRSPCIPVTFSTTQSYYLQAFSANSAVVGCISAECW